MLCHTFIFSNGYGIKTVVFPTRQGDDASSFESLTESGNFKTRNTAMSHTAWVSVYLLPRLQPNSAIESSCDRYHSHSYSCQVK